MAKSTDKDHYPASLKVRWDWESDGVWDTDYSSKLTENHFFNNSGIIIVSCELIDPDGLYDIKRDSVYIFPIPEFDQMIDQRDGMIYKIVKINDNWWMAENLKYGNHLSSSINQTNNQVPEFYCYNNDYDNFEKYGGLYTYEEAMNYNQGDNQGICPDGWEIPSANDFYKISLNAPYLFLMDFYGPNGEGGLSLDYPGMYQWAAFSHNKQQDQGYVGKESGGYFWISDLTEYGDNNPHPNGYVKVRYALMMMPISDNMEVDDFYLRRSFYYNWVSDQKTDDGSIVYFKIAASVRCIKRDE